MMKPTQPQLLMSLLLLLSVTSTALHCEPIRPSSDNFVIERFPKQHRAITKNFFVNNKPGKLNTSDDVEETINRTTHYLKLARQFADPRLLGFAQAMINPWVNSPNPPTDILVLQALIKQANHHFDSALGFLDLALQQAPKHTQALLTRASIHQVLGQYQAALRDCRQLLTRATTIIGTACIATITGLSGQLAQSLQVLQRLSGSISSLSMAQYRWVMVAMADMAERLNYPTLAAHYYQSATSGEQVDHYVNEAYAGFLLQTQQFQQLLRFVENAPLSDGMLVRKAIAENALGLANAKTTRKLLEQRFARTNARGEQKHLREQAYFNAYVLNNPEKALALAKSNWRQQREPVDTLLYARLAVQQQDGNAIREITQWLDKNHYQDRRLNTLLTKTVTL